MESIVGTISRYIFYNETNGYGIIKLQSGETVVGVFPKLKKGETAEFFGEWVMHKTYGIQFKAEKLEKKKPTTTEGIIKYLSSGIIKGVNEKLAKRIVNAFGTKALTILKEEPYRLLQIHGIGEKKLQGIIKSWKENEAHHEILLYLTKHGVSSTRAFKIYNFYGPDTIELLKENPYRMVYDIEGIGFKIADSIAKELGFGEHHPLRLQAWVIYFLREFAARGNVFVPIELFYSQAEQILHYSFDEDTEILLSLEQREEIVLTENKIYLSELYYAERGIEKFISSLLKSRTNFIHLGKDVASRLEKLFSAEQFEGIKSALHNKVTIITGGPGTGKTTTVKGIIDIYKDNGKQVILAAPTGRAAKRMNELIGMEAKTIHRLLEFNPMDFSFFYNEENKITADLIVVDEVSMIDTYLMYHLFAAIGTNTSVVLVGDTNQLPSVGPGNILHDLIESKKVPVIEFTKIFRQSETSGIVKLAHAIREGKNIDFGKEDYEDIIFIEKENSNSLTRLITELVANRIPKKFGYNPIEDIQVLSPMYKGQAGVNELNLSLQNALNKNNLSENTSRFNAGDKVMQLRNDYEKNVFNGDIGIVEKKNSSEKKIIVRYDFRMVSYKFEELDDLTLAYAITIHKSQGSEYPCVIIPLSFSHRIMLRRKLIYTAVTRTRELLILIGSPKALDYAIQNSAEEERYSSLFKLGI